MLAGNRLDWKSRVERIFAFITCCSQRNTVACCERSTFQWSSPNGQLSLFNSYLVSAPTLSMTMSISVTLKQNWEWFRGKQTRHSGNPLNSPAPSIPRWCLCWPGTVGTAPSPATGFTRRSPPPPPDRSFTWTSCRLTRWEHGSLTAVPPRARQWWGSYIHRLCNKPVELSGVCGYEKGYIP